MTTWHADDPAPPCTIGAEEAPMSDDLTDPDPVTLRERLLAAAFTGEDAPGATVVRVDDVLAMLGLPAIPDPDVPAPVTAPLGAVEVYATVVLDGSPFDVTYTNDLTISYDYKHLPEPWLAAITALGQKYDEASCQAAACGTFRRDKAQPAAPVGWTLHEPEDYGDRGYSQWHYTALVMRTDGSIIAVCEECSPGSAYDEPQTEGEPLVAAPALTVAP